MQRTWKARIKTSFIQLTKQLMMMTMFNETMFDETMMMKQCLMKQCLIQGIYYNLQYFDSCYNYQAVHIDNFLEAYVRYS